MEPLVNEANTTSQMFSDVDESMDKLDFEWAVWNDWRVALKALWNMKETANAQIAQLQADLAALQETVLELSAAVNAPQ